MLRQPITVLALVTLLASGIVGCGRQSTATTPILVPAGGIGFVSDRDGNQEIYVMNADGSSQTDLSNSRVSEVEPVWSPDGSKILFAVERPWPLGGLFEDEQLYVMNANGGNRLSLTGSYSNYIYGNQAWSPDSSRIIYWFGKIFSEGDIYVVNVDGSNRINLTNSPAFYDGMAWSPDGSKIAFVVEIENWIDKQHCITSRAIHVMNADGSNRIKFTTSFEPNWELVWSPDGSRITFWSEVECDNAEMYVMNADGSAQTNLTNNPAYDGTMVWSPDGTRIAFVRWDGNWEIYVMNADGSNMKKLASGAAEPAWSPDGTKISFTSYRGICLMDADGSNETDLTNNPCDNHPAWSPDGTKIVFSSNRDGNWEIYVMNVDGSNQTNLTNNPAHDDAPAWSPDGTKIAFVSDRNGNREIHVMNADGSNPTDLIYSFPMENSPEWSSNGLTTIGFHLEDYPAWSTDGTKIAFCRPIDSGLWSEIYVANADGTNPTNLTPNTIEYASRAVTSSPTWSPDGSKIAFARFRSGFSEVHVEIYVMDADGSNQVRLTKKSDVGSILITVGIALLVVSIPVVVIVFLIVWLLRRRRRAAS